MTSPLRDAARRRLAAMPFATGVGTLTAGQAASAAVGLISTTVAARWLGATTFGQASIVIAVPNLVLSFAGVKTLSVTLTHIAARRVEQDYPGLLAVIKLGYSIDVAIALAAVAIVTAVSLVAPVADTPWWLTVAYAASFPLLSLGGTSYAVLAGAQRFPLIALLQVGQSTVTLGAVLVGISMAASVRHYVIALALAQAIGGVLWAVMAQATLRREVDTGWWSANMRTVREMAQELRGQFGWNYVGASAAGAIGQLPIILLGAWRSPVESGFYRLASSLVTVGGYIETSLWRVSNTALSVTLARGDRDNAAAMIRRWASRHGPIAGALVILIVPVLPIAIPLVFGHEYRLMIPGAQLMLMAAAVSTVFFYVSPLLYAMQRLALWVIPITVYTVAMIVGQALVLTRYGFFGAASVFAVFTITFRTAMGVAVLRRTRRWSAP